MVNVQGSDLDAILARRHDNGTDYWAGPQGKIYVGNPFSTIGALGMLHELGVGPEHEAAEGALELVLEAGRDDGRIRVGPTSPMYPCYTAEAARMLCRFGLTEHETVGRAVEYLLGSVHESGGWRCSFSRFGEGPRSDVANPGATLYALDVLRFFPAHRGGVAEVDEAVESLLEHWEVREPTGPCRWGIGSLFLQVEYPFLRYNLFYYVYVLSFFDRAGGDPRFEEALEVLRSKTSDDGRMIVERPHRALKSLEFCAENEPSGPATARYREIFANLGRTVPF